MAYPGLKFVYNGTDSEGVYVEIDDTKGNYFGPSYFEVDTSFEGHYGYETVPNTEGGDTRNADYTFKDFLDDYLFDNLNPKDLKKNFLKCFENHLIDTLFNVSKSFHSSYIGDDFEKISGYKKCLRLAKKEVDLDSLVESWNECVLSCIKDDIESYYKHRDLERRPGEDSYLNDCLKTCVEDIKCYRDFNKVKYKNFNIRNYIESKRYENLDDVFDFIVNGEGYFN